MELNIQYRDVDEDPCAPCDEIDFTGSRSGLLECSELISVESYTDCRTLCENILKVENEKSTRKRDNAIENCRCFCKSLMPNCPGKFNTVDSG